MLVESFERHESRSGIESGRDSRGDEEEDLFFKSFTQQIKEVIEQYPTASAVASGSIVLLALPPTRRLFWRSTIGRFESEEQAFAKLMRRAQMLKDGATSTDGALRGFSEETKLAITEINL